ncbi:MAG: hypothetical protein AAGB93_02415 [Planctomycetota bacterium]
MSLPLLVASALALGQADSAELDAFLPDHVLFDVTAEGAHWVLGHSYKASVDTSGLRFVPYLGSDSAVHREATFHVRSLSAGDAPVELAPPTVRREGEALLLDRGPLVARYACSIDAVEQILEIDLTGLSGAIRVEVDVATRLARPVEARAPYRFGGSDAAIDVGAAFVLTDHGEKLAVDSFRTQGGYAIEVPEGLVRAAGSRLVLDPVITSGTIIAIPPIPFIAADCAFVGPAARFVAVERAFSSSDSDVIVYRAPSSIGTPATFVSSIDISSENWEEPAITGTNSTGDIMVVATRGLGTGRRIYGRGTRTDGASTGAPFLVSSLFAEGFDADIGVENGGALIPRRFVVVWTNRIGSSSDVFARALDRNGIAGTIRQVDDVQTDSMLPAISQSAGGGSNFDSQRFRVAFKQTDGSGNESIWTADLNRNATVTRPAWRVADCDDTDGVSVSSSNDYRLPDGSAPYVIVWDSGFNFLSDIYAATCSGGTVRGEIANLSVQSNERRTNEQRRPSVVATNNQWLIVYEERELPSNRQVFLCSGRPAPRTFGLVERNQLMVGPAGMDASVSVTSSFAGGIPSGSSETGFAAWIDRSGPTSLQAAYLQGISGPGAAGTQYCSANRNSTGRRSWIWASGDGQVDQPHTIECIDAPAAAPCFILTAREPGFVPSVGGSAGNLCLGGLGFGRFSNFVGPTTANGRYSLTLDPENIAQANGTVSALPGETWYFQAWFRDGSPSGPTSNLSNGVAIQFVN